MRYCDRLDCQWEIEPGDPGTAIRIGISSFSTEPTHDYLQVFQTENDETVPLVKYYINLRFT